MNLSRLKGFSQGIYTQGFCFEVSNGQAANQTNFNDAFMSRTADTNTTGKVDLDESSSTVIVDLQATVNAKSIAPATSADNKLLKTSGVDGTQLEETGVIVDDSDNITGVNDLTVDGDLIVSGTTVTLNTTVLDVEDTNITVNNGGNDASSEGAGITVERTGTDGSLVYEDALTSKFKFGALGSEIEGVTVSDTQTITNKTIDADDNSLVDFDGPGNETVAGKLEQIALHGGPFLTPVANSGLRSRDDAGSGIITPVIVTDFSFAGFDVDTVLFANTKVGAQIILGTEASSSATQTGEVLQNSGANSGSGDSGPYTGRSGAVESGISGSQNSRSGDANASGGRSGDVVNESGSAVDAATGDVINRTGPTGGARGSIKNIDGSEGVINHVWTQKAVDGSGTWQALPAGAAGDNESSLLENLGLSATPSAGALTIALKQSDGSTDPAAAPNAVRIGYRSATLADASFSIISTTAALPLVIPSGDPLGYIDGDDVFVHVYSLLFGGASELGVAGSRFLQDGELATTLALSSGADLASTLYSTTARTNVPVRYLGFFRIDAITTAGTWTAPDKGSLYEIDCLPTFNPQYFAWSTLNPSTGVDTAHAEGTQTITLPIAGDYKVSVFLTSEHSDAFTLARHIVTFAGTATLKGNASAAPQASDNDNTNLTNATTIVRTFSVTSGQTITIAPTWRSDFSGGNHLGDVEYLVEYLSKAVD